jgi:pantoate--beta-alanine ligase
MDVVKQAARMQTIARRLHATGRRIGLVPTAGNLHEGHLSLIRRAQEMCHTVIVSIVSPAALLPPSEKGLGGKHWHPEEQAWDLPRDVEVVASTGVDYVFAPSIGEIFPEDASTVVLVRGLSEKLHGGLHPEHATQITTVLAILFHLIRPHVVVFGWKDGFQVALVKRMIRDLRMDVDVSVCPIVREPSGLALSGDNERLSPREREAAAVLYQALERVQVLVAAGERDTVRLIRAMREVIESQPLARIESLSIVDSETLEPMATLGERPALVTVVAQIGRTRLSDNLLVTLA